MRSARLLNSSMAVPVMSSSLKPRTSNSSFAAAAPMELPRSTRPKQQYDFRGVALAAQTARTLRTAACVRFITARCFGSNGRHFLPFAIARNSALRRDRQQSKKGRSNLHHRSDETFHNHSRGMERHGEGNRRRKRGARGIRPDALRHRSRLNANRENQEKKPGRNSALNSARSSDRYEPAWAAGRPINDFDHRPQQRPQNAARC